MEETLSSNTCALCGATTRTTRYGQRCGRYHAPHHLVFVPIEDIAAAAADLPAYARRRYSLAPRSRRTAPRPRTIDGEPGVYRV